MSLDFDSLYERLTPLGWQVERSPEGDILLWPPASGAIREPAVRFFAGSDSALARITEEEFRSRLRAHGWKVETAGDGSLLLTPPTKTPPTTDSSHTLPPAYANLADLTALLRISGWRVETEPEGSLLLYPPGMPAGETSLPDSPGSTERTDSRECTECWKLLEQRGWDMEPAAGGGFKLSPLRPRSGH